MRIAHLSITSQYFAGAFYLTPSWMGFCADLPESAGKFVVESFCRTSFSGNSMQLIILRISDSADFLLAQCSINLMTCLPASVTGKHYIVCFLVSLS